MGYCDVCGDEAIVGVGKDATLLCLTHFQEYLTDARKVIDQAKEMLAAKEL